MKETTIKDASLEAQKIVEPFAQTHASKLKSLLNNAATIISLSIIALTMLLFAYNQGYASVYHLPVNVIPLNLEAYLSLAVTIVTLLTYIFYYIACKKSDDLLSKKRFNFLAVFYGVTIILTLLYKYHFERVVGPITCIVIAVVASMMVELVPRFVKKNRGDKIINSTTKELKKEDFTWDKILYLLYVRNGIWILVICVSLAPLVGSIIARAKPDYQTCTYDAKTYAIIVEYEDQVLVQRADIQNDTITIATNSYWYLPKDSLEVTFSTYDVVLIQEDF